MDRVRAGVKDKRVLMLVKTFRKAGIMKESGQIGDNPTGTPQGSILSPLLANIVLSVLDEHVHGPRLREEIADVIAPLHRRMSQGQDPHMSEGFDFLGFRSQWKPKRGTNQWYVYVFIANRPVVEGQDSCPHEQAVATATQGRADQAQPDHARLAQLLPVCRRQKRHAIPGHVRVAQDRALVDTAAPLELDRYSTPTHRPQRPMANVVSTRPRTDSTISAPRQQDRQALGYGQPRLTAETVESPVRGDAHAGFGERPAETLRWRHRHRAAGRLNHPRRPVAVHRRRTRNHPGSNRPDRTEQTDRLHRPIGIGPQCNRRVSLPRRIRRRPNHPRRPPRPLAVRRHLAPGQSHHHRPATRPDRSHLTTNPRPKAMKDPPAQASPHIPAPQAPRRGRRIWASGRAGRAAPPSSRSVTEYQGQKKRGESGSPADRYFLVAQRLPAEAVQAQQIATAQVPEAGCLHGILNVPSPVVRGAVRRFSHPPEKSGRPHAPPGCGVCPPAFRPC